MRQSARAIYPGMALALLFSSSALGDSISDTHRFRLGVYEQDVDVDASATRDGFPKTEIDFDSVLGLDESSTQAIFTYQWRFREKWSAQLFYSKLEANGKRVATKDFNWDGQDYSAGVGLETDFDLDTFMIVANYSIVRNEKMEYGIGVGLHGFDIDTTIEARVRLDEVREEGSRNSADVLAPLPNLRAFGTYMINPKWEVGGNLGWLSFSYDDYDGGYLYLQAFTEYRFTERFGIGLAYQVAEIDISHDDGDREIEFNVDMYGPSLFLTYGF